MMHCLISQNGKKQLCSAYNRICEFMDSHAEVDYKEENIEVFESINESIIKVQSGYIKRLEDLMAELKVKFSDPKCLRCIKTEPPQVEEPPRALTS